MNAAADRVAAAKAAQAAREAGIRAQAIKEGRRLERAEILEAAGASVIDEIALLPQIRVEHAAELARLELANQAATRRAFGHGFWRGGTIVGVSVAGILVAIMALYGLFVINTTFDASRDMQTGRAITDQIAAERARGGNGVNP